MNQSKMYNGLGLRTPRGSGTSGYVQKNLSFAKPKNQSNFQYDQPPPKPARKPNAEILLHRSKRQIEVECLTLEEELQQSGKYTEEEINDKIKAYRNKLSLKLENDIKRNKDEVLKEQKETEMERLKDAFGIRNDAVEGQAFKFESEKDRQERLARLAEEDRLQRTRPKRLRDR